jgi:adenylate cyclase class IV
MTTDTPRTDEQIWTTSFDHKLCDVVDVEFARKLERELSASKAEVERIKNPIKIKVSKRPYYYECGDGCCSEAGETWFVNGEEICSGMCDDNRLQQLLKHLGYEAKIVNENEDGEELCSL